MSTANRGRWGIQAGALLCAGGVAVLAGRAYVRCTATGPVASGNGSRHQARGEVLREGARRGAHRGPVSRRRTALPVDRYAKLRAALRLAPPQALRTTPAPPIPPETPLERAARHRRLEEHLTQTLGEISPVKRQALIALNDEAVAVDRGLSQSLMDGTLSHAQYISEYRQAKRAQLADLRRVVTLREYEALTGLRVDTDPFEYMETGEGAAHAEHTPPEDVSAATEISKE